MENFQKILIIIARILTSINEDDTQPKRKFVLDYFVSYMDIGK